MQLPSAETFVAFETNEHELVKLFNALHSKDRSAAVSAYLKLCRTLLLNGKSFGKYLHDMLIFSEQPLVEKYIKSRDQLIYKAIEYDVRRINEMALFGASELKEYLSLTFNEDMSELPEFEKGDFPYDADYFVNHCAKNGSGVFAQYKAFTFNSGEMKPVKRCDSIKLSDLKKYEVQKKQIVENTLCFINDKPANNVLLYGDRGTGKSSTIKALLNEYESLRMVQMDKTQISKIFDLYEILGVVPLHFIIFIDDLSFSEDDEGYFMFKQALDGSLAVKPENVLIYATTNRRHIIKETAANRVDSYIHKSDAIDDNMSLSERFGLFVTFTAPNKEQFLEIAIRIACDRGINIDKEAFCSGLERFALKRGGRSPRIAKQYVDMLEAKLSLGMEIS